MFNWAKKSDGLENIEEIGLPLQGSLGWTSMGEKGIFMCSAEARVTQMIYSNRFVFNTPLTNQY